jgi:hypothetical protein
MASNAFKIGRKVRFLNEVGEGVVTQMLPDGRVMVEDESGFEYPHFASDLIIVHDAKTEAQAYERAIPSVMEILQQELTPERQKRMEKEFKSKYAEASAHQHAGQEMEVDLHLHALVDSQAGLSPSVMLELQIAHFERMLQIGIRQRTKKLVFIHGIGQGVLRHQIWSRVEQYYPDCSCRSADPRKYGSGATEVWVGESAFRS